MLTNAQCDINLGCSADPALNIDPPTFDPTTFSIVLDNIEFGGFECTEAVYQAGIAIYIYQLLPDGSRMTQCAVVNEPPYNVVGSIAFSFGQTSLCPLIQPIGSLSIGPTEGFEACDGAYLEIEAALYVTTDMTFDSAVSSIFSDLSDSEYLVVNLGNLEVNINNEFPGEGQPLTTAKIKDFNSDSEGPLTLACGENIELFLEGLSRIANCLPYEDISTGISSELTNEFYYTINGGEPVIVLDASTGATGGQLTGPDAALGGLCYAGVLTNMNAYSLEFSELPPDLCDGSNIVFTLKTIDLFTNVTAEDQFTVIYSGGTGCGATCAVEPHCDSPCYAEYNPSPVAGSEADPSACITILDCETIAASGLEATCADIANCTPSSCPTVYLNDDNLPSLPEALCVGDLLELCFDIAVDEAIFLANSIEFNYDLLVAGNAASVDLTNTYSSGTAIDANATGQICFSAAIPAGANACEAYELSLEIESVFYRDADCADDFVAYDLNLTSPLPVVQTGDNLNDLVPLLGIAGLNPILVQVYPNPNWTAQVTQAPACDGTTQGIVEVYATDGTLCDTVTDLGTAGTDGQCPADNADFPEFTYTAFETFVVLDQNEMDSIVVNPCAINVIVPAQSIACVEMCEVPGCTDPCDPNFDPMATQDDPSLCAGYDTTCDDNDCSTIDAYDTTTCSCTNTPDPNLPLACDDGICSNGVETYNAATCSCEQGTPPVDPGCDDGDCNTEDSYDTETCSCVNTPIDPLNCDDNDCTTEDAYDSATCSCINTPITPPDCDDNDCNTEDSYDTTSCTCVNTPIDPPNCDDNDCTTEDSYDSATCTCVNAPITPPDCDDNDCNTEDNYDTTTCICVNTPIDPPTCDDGICGTEDSYNSATCTCVNTPIVPPVCDDGVCSNGVETYNAETCECEAGVPGEIPTCDDGDCNTEDAYDEANCICVNTPIDPPNCDDNDCNTEDAYDLATCTCVNTPIDPLDCDDGDCNTEDVYDSATCTCVNTPIDPPDCDDSDCNTEDAYDSGTCTCVNTPITPPVCDDGDCSNGVETYNAETCMCEPGVPGETPNCDDGICSNGIETYNEATCSCEAGTPPDDTCPEDTCFEEYTWDENTCTCVVAIIDHFCDDGVCANGVETFNEETCSCEPGTPPDDTCPESTCFEMFTWDTESCTCVGFAVEYDCDDSDNCTNDFVDETICECVNEPIVGCGESCCTDPCGLNFDPDCTTDGGSCTYANIDDNCELTEDSIDQMTCEVLNVPNCPAGTTFNAMECSCNTACVPPVIGTFDCE